MHPVPESVFLPSAQRIGQRIGTWLAFALTVITATSQSALAQSDTITLGAAIAFTGKHSINAIHTRNGHQLAVDTINTGGGVKIAGRSFKLALRYVDDKSTPTETATRVEELISEDGIQFMLGPYGTENIQVAAELTEKYGIPMVQSTSASQSLFTHDFRYLFSILSTTDKYLSGVLALAAANAKKIGKKANDLKVALAFDRGAFSQEIRSGAVAASTTYEMEVIIDDRLPKSLDDVSATLLKVLSLKPDVFLLSGHARGAATAVRQMSEMQVSVPVIGMTHCEAARILTNNAIRAEHIICPTHWSAEVNYSGAHFGSATDYDRQFKKAFPDYTSVPYQAAQASAAVLVFKDAMQRANSLDRNAVRDALASTSLNTFYGPIEFADSGQNRTKPMVLRQVQGGKFKVIVPPPKSKRSSR